MTEQRELFLGFHGRVLEHLGIQMYQSPVNAVAELIANAWDGDAEKVNVILPADLSPEAVLVIEDNGRGMSFDDCQKLYLQVGLNRRANDPDAKTLEKGRPVLGRKGIGKFAGFGIAQVMRIGTISKTTGEHTVFELDLEELLGDEYLAASEMKVPAIEYEAGTDDRKSQHGTVITLRNLNIKQTPSAEQFSRSMARRFLLHQQQADFGVTINDQDLPEAWDLAGVQYIFPRDYATGEAPDGLILEDGGWGTEDVAGHRIRWRFLFHKETIDEEELRGVSVFAKGKLAQAPFLFNLTGGLGGQHGVEYLAGQVEANFVDSLPRDVIATERQRINWGLTETEPLLTWGQERVKRLLRIWHDRRGEQRARQLEEKIAGFSERLGRLSTHERNTVSRALKALAAITTLNDAQFEDLGSSVLTAWEQGRLQDLISHMAEAESLSSEELLEILVEAEVLAALNTAEAVKTKLLTVAGLSERVDKRELENSVRDYIASNPWLIAPEWETFKIERGVLKFVREVAHQVGFTDEQYKGRMDLVLASGHQLLILDFMRPGLSLDWDHIVRFEHYIRIIQAGIDANTAGQFKTVGGHIVADGLLRKTENLKKIQDMRADEMLVRDWPMLFRDALAQWKDFLGAVVLRAPDDARLLALLEDVGAEGEEAGD